MAPVVPDRGARQGPKGRSVLYVLVGALALAGLYLVGMMTWSTTTSPPDKASQSQDASRKATTGSAPSSANTGGVPAANPAYPAPAEPKR